MGSNKGISDMMMPGMPMMGMSADMKCSKAKEKAMQMEKDRDAKRVKPDGMKRKMGGMVM